MKYSNQSCSPPMHYTQQSQSGTTISEDKMEIIIDAILEGRYSYACLMTLEATGHEPTQYIPYRTYNRLQKQRQASYRHDRHDLPAAHKVSPLRPKISEIDYIEPLQESGETISGGKGGRWDEYSEHNVLFWPR